MCSQVFKRGKFFFEALHTENQFKGGLSYKYLFIFSKYLH